MIERLVDKKLEELGILLPQAVSPVAEYVPARHVDQLVYVSGQGPAKEGQFLYVGKVGAEVTLEQGYESARLCALNALAAVKDLLGSLDRVIDVVQVRGFVNSAPDFHEQPQVVNGASDLLVQVFGEHGRHARAALGTCNLPGDIPVEIEFVFRVA